MKILFAHGFEGSANGTKPTYLRDTLGHEVVAPKMHELGWTFDGHVRTVLQVLDAHPDIEAVVGSSMGGFASAVALSQRPDRAIVAALLAPAVGIHNKWSEEYGTEAMQEWAESGTKQYWHRSWEKYIELPYSFWTECRDAAGVQINHPCVIIHGLDDTVVPIENSEELALRSPGVREVIKTPDGHRLAESLHHLKPVLESLCP